MIEIWACLKVACLDGLHSANKTSSIHAAKHLVWGGCVDDAAIRRDPLAGTITP